MKSSSSGMADMESSGVVVATGGTEEIEFSLGLSTPLALGSPPTATTAVPSFSSSGKVQLVKASHILSIMTKGPVKDWGGGRVVKSIEARGGTGNSPPGTGFVPAGTERLGLKGICHQKDGF